MKQRAITLWVLLALCNLSYYCIIIICIHTGLSLRSLQVCFVSLSLDLVYRFICRHLYDLESLSLVCYRFDVDTITLYWFPYYD